MAHTRHGHHIPGSLFSGQAVLVARCGGPTLCEMCRTDVEVFFVKDPNKENSMAVKTSTTRELSCSPSELTVGDLLDFCSGMDRDAKVQPYLDHGDRPGERGLFKLSGQMSNNTR